MFSHAIEEPKYELIRNLDNVMLRPYAPVVVAWVMPDGAGSRAFLILAGRVFGKNKGEGKLAMAAAVTQAAARLTMEMTAMVTPAAVPSGMRVQFVLPEGWFCAALAISPWSAVHALGCLKLAAAKLEALPLLGRDFLRAQVIIEQSIEPRWARRPCRRLAPGPGGLS